MVFQFPISSLGLNFYFCGRALTGDDRIKLHLYLVVVDSFLFKMKLRSDIGNAVIVKLGTFEEFLFDSKTCSCR